MSSVPPAIIARSRMPVSPMPAPDGRPSKPRPSSATRATTSGPSRRRATCDVARRRRARDVGKTLLDDAVDGDLLLGTERRRALPARGRAPSSTPVWRSKSPIFERTRGREPMVVERGGAQLARDPQQLLDRLRRRLLRLAQLGAQLLAARAGRSPGAAAARRSAPGWPRRAGRARSARARPPARAARRWRPGRARPAGGRACGRRRGAGARPRRLAGRQHAGGRRASGSRRTPSRDQPLERLEAPPQHQPVDEHRRQQRGGQQHQVALIAAE